MANWKHILRIGDIFADYHEDKIALTDLARGIASRIGKLPCYNRDLTLMDIAEQFECFDEDEWTSPEDEFNTLMEQLYDWGDTILNATWPTDRMCWIETTHVECHQIAQEGQQGL